MSWLKIMFPILLLVGAGLVAISARGYRSEHARLVAVGVPGMAEVVAKRIEQEHGPGKTSGSTSVFLIAYRLQPEAASPIENEAAFPVDVFERVKPGDSLKVIYNPVDPRVHEFEDSGVLVSGSNTYTASTGEYGYVFSAILVAVALAWLLFVWRRGSLRS